MTLIDAGPLIALIDRKDPHHRLCVAAASTLPADRFLTTWPCFTEAMYILRRIGGPSGQEALWNLRRRQALEIHDLSTAETDRMADLMRTYYSVSMDLADASLVATAEALHIHQVFTLDGDFRIYRLHDGSVLDLIP